MITNIISLHKEYTDKLSYPLIVIDALFRVISNPETFMHLSPSIMCLSINNDNNSYNKNNNNNNSASSTPYSQCSNMSIAYNRKRFFFWDVPDNREGKFEVNVQLRRVTLTTTDEHSHEMKYSYQIGMHAVALNSCCTDLYSCA